MYTVKRQNKTRSRITGGLVFSEIDKISIKREQSIRCSLLLTNIHQQLKDKRCLLGTPGPPPRPLASLRFLLPPLSPASLVSPPPVFQSPPKPPNSVSLPLARRRISRLRASPLPSVRDCPPLLTLSLVALNLMLQLQILQVKHPQGTLDP